MKIAWYGVLTIGLLAASCGKDSANTRSKTPTVSQDLSVPSFTLAEGSVATQSRRASVKLIWDSELRAETMLEATLSFFDEKAQAATQVEGIEFIPEMPSMGHGTDMEDQKYELLSPGVFKVTGIYLTMGGPWTITVKANINGKHEVATIDIDVP